MARSTYLTVTIPYVNAAPHLGYAYELVLADVAARARRQASGAGAVRFCGGTDDYSLKNVIAAESAGVPTAAFVRGHAQRFAALRGPLSLSFDDFIRTSSDARHAPAVTRLWEAVAARGDLYKRAYAGDYCTGCEQFHDAAAVGGRCPEHGTALERIEEDNWFFRLSAHQDALERLLAGGALRVTPAPFAEEALAFVRSGLEDISVSRSAARARGWGIPVPGDAGQVVYVWFDALANYISALGYETPGAPDLERWWRGPGERIHVVGKGILRFHAVIWPALLLAAGEPPPTRVHVHPYLSVAGAKLSKSSGTTVDPVELAGRYGVDAVRWWLARDVHPTVDTDFTEERLVERANEDLAGGVANLVSRVVALLHRYGAGVVPAVEAVDGAGGAGGVDRAGWSVVDEPLRTARAALADLDLRRGTALVVVAVGALNRDLEVAAPWRLAREGQAGRREALAVLARHVRAAAAVAETLRPVVPDLAERLLDQLAGGVPGAPLPPRRACFPRIEEVGLGAGAPAPAPA